MTRRNVELVTDAIAEVREHSIVTADGVDRCRSWYQDQRTGENTALWPGSVLAYTDRTRAVSPADYELM